MDWGEDAEPIRWDDLYLIARGWGIQPGEFWDMTMTEFMLEWEHRRPADPQNDYAGSLTEAAILDLLAWDETADGIA